MIWQTASRTKLLDQQVNHTFKCGMLQIHAMKDGTAPAGSAVMAIRGHRWTCSRPAGSSATSRCSNPCSGAVRGDSAGPGSRISFSTSCTHACEMTMGGQP
jgi:hypothetical protein